jgi:predicted ester cyclase
MERYLDALAARGNYGQFFADDVTLSIEGADQHAVGRDAVEQTIRWIYEQAFDAYPEVKSLVVGRGKATVEADFVGTHTGEFAGVPPTGRRVRVPFSVTYEVRGGAISAVRVYMPMDDLYRQLGRGPNKTVSPSSAQARAKAHPARSSPMQPRRTP